MTDYGIIIRDKCGIPVVDGEAIMLKLQAEGEVTVPAATSVYVQGSIAINFTPCTSLPIISIIDIDSKTQTYYEDFCSFAALTNVNGNNQYYQFTIYNYSVTTTKMRWKVWVRNDI